MSHSVRIENPAQDTYVLRNTSGHELSEVLVDASRIGNQTRNLPAGMDLSDGEGVEFHMYKHGGTPPPDRLYVRWEGEPDWVPVPIE